MIGHRKRQIMRFQFTRALICSCLVVMAASAYAASTAQVPIPSPWVEGSVTCATDDWTVASAPEVTVDALAAGTTFQSVAGGLPVGAEHGMVMDGVEALLATGTLAYGPEPDLLINNSRGSDAVFQRSYRSNRAFAGYASPGLSSGWVHNYDIKIESATPKSWGTLDVVYPSGARDTLTPILNGSGQATGSFKPGGFPFVPSGRPGPKPGTWKDFVLHWKDGGEWRFRPSLAHEGAYTLYVMSGLEISYDAKGRIKSVADLQSPKSPLIAWTYDTAGYLKSISGSDGTLVDYTFEPFTKPATPCLKMVSFGYSKTSPADPQPHFTFDYQDVDGQLLLKEVTMPSPTGSGRAACTFEFDDGRLHSFTGPSGSFHEYQYGEGNTAVSVKEASGKLLLTWTQLWDNLGRNTGNIDAHGNKTTNEYH